MAQTGEGPSVVVVARDRSRAIVPVGGDQVLALPEGSVTLKAIRRAARRVQDQRDQTNVASIVEATVQGLRSRAGLACGCGNGTRD